MHLYVEVIWSFSSFELFHHDGLLTHVFDLLDHVEFFVYISIVSFEKDGHLSESCVTCAVGTSWKLSNLSELGPTFSLIDLGTARVDPLDNFDLFGLDYVILFVPFDNFLETYRNFTVYQSHFNFIYKQRIDRKKNNEGILCLVIIFHLSIIFTKIVPI